ncbi:MAG: CRISPR system precrRNA processing endoribonuclease RAMP protein Cas6 [Alphaproteobacteria bacterium]
MSGDDRTPLVPEPSWRARRAPPPPPGAHPALAARLTDPLGWMGFDRLTRHWRTVTIRVVFARPPLLEEDGPGLAGRLRGAWGWALDDLARAEPDHGLPGAAPSAHDALFRANALWAPGMEVPKPYVLTVDADGRRLTARVTLFGFAGRWAADTVEALLMAGARGLTLRPGGPVRAALAAESVAVDRVETLPPLPQPRDGALTLLFDTPLKARHGAALKLDAASILGGLANRVTGLARWQDLGVEDDFAALAQAVVAVDADLSALRPIGWTRRSTRAPDAPISMEGVTGALTLRGDVERLLPILRLGTLTHAGNDTTFGLGRFRVAGDGWAAGEPCGTERID